MRIGFVFSRVCSIFLILLIFFSVFSIGVYAQNSAESSGIDTTEPDIADEDSGSSRYTFNCAVASCFEGYDCVEGEGCVLREGANFGNCGDEESYDHASRTCRGIDFKYIDN